MKKRVRVFVWVVGLLIVLPGIVSAQKPKAQMYLVEECLVRPSAAARFWEALKEEVAFYAKNKFPYPWKTYAEENGRAYFVIPVKDLADIDNYFKADAEIVSKDASEYQAVMAKFAGTFESFKTMVFNLQPEFSMIPENPYYPPGEMNFICLDIWSMEPGKEAEAEKNIQETMAIVKKRGVRDTWYCLVGGLGTEQPVYVDVGPDKDETEFIKHNAEMWKLMGADISELYKKSLSMLRKRETRRLWHQPELSYTPIK
jgi:hypothetical protein